MQFSRWPPIVFFVCFSVHSNEPTRQLVTLHTRQLGNTLMSDSMMPGYNARYLTQHQLKLQQSATIGPKEETFFVPQSKPPMLWFRTSFHTSHLPTSNSSMFTFQLSAEQLMLQIVLRSTMQVGWFPSKQPAPTFPLCQKRTGSCLIIFVISCPRTTTQRIPYKRRYNLDHPTHRVASLCGESSVRQQGPAVRSQIHAEVYRNHWRYEQQGNHWRQEQCTDSAESSLTCCLQILLLRCQQCPLKTTSSPQPCLFLCQRSNQNMTHQLISYYLKLSTDRMFFCFSFNYCKLVVNGIKLCECE